MFRAQRGLWLTLALFLSLALASSAFAVCGDIVPDPGEQCDDGNAVETDGCKADCTLPAPATFTVDSSADGVDAAPGDGVCATTGGACTLRAAVQEANARGSDDAIVLPAGTYQLTVPRLANDADPAVGDLDTTGSLSIVGDGADDTIIDANSVDRAFEVRGTLHLSDLSVRNGSTPEPGGAVNVIAGALTLTRCAMSDNVSSDLGGAIAVSSGATADIVASTLSGNAAVLGGAVHTNGGVTLHQSTVSGNFVGCGGTLFANSGGTGEVADSTIADNQLDPGCGGASAGLSGDNGAFTLRGTIIARNMGGNCTIAIVSDGHNLADDASCAFSGSGDLSSVADAGIDVLAANGGPTLTHALQPGSPALDAGGSACADQDQRGVPRPQLTLGACDIGAVESYVWPAGSILVAHRLTNGQHAITLLDPSGVPMRRFGLEASDEFRAHLAIAGGLLYRSQGTYHDFIDQFAGPGGAARSIRAQDPVPHKITAIARNFSGQSLAYKDDYYSSGVFNLDDPTTGASTFLTSFTAGVRDLYFGGPAGSEALYALAGVDPMVGPSSIAKVDAMGGVTYFSHPDLLPIWITDIGSVAVDASNGDIFAVTSEKVVRMDAAGASLGSFSLTDFKPSLDIGSDGNLYVGLWDSATGEIRVVSPSGTPVRSINVPGATGIIDVFIVPGAPKASAGESCAQNSDCANGACVSGTCVVAVCGNGFVESGETCDDGNTADGDGCSSTCVVPGCSTSLTGVWSTGSQSFSMIDHGANVTVVLSASGMGAPFDLGALNFTRSGDTLTLSFPSITIDIDSCTQVTVNSGPPTAYTKVSSSACGDGTQDPGEACDDGNSTNGDGCSIACTLPACGDLVTDPGESCDDGNTADGDDCPSTCVAGCDTSVTGVWSSGMQSLSMIDHGANVTVVIPLSGFGAPFDLAALNFTRSGDTLSFLTSVTIDIDSCTQVTVHSGASVVPYTKVSSSACGDGTQDPGEACDDGNSLSGDGCSIACTLPVCGDLVPDPGEQCDDGNASSNDACKTNCTNNICGDGVRFIGPEACDDGNPTNGDGCETDCTVTRWTFNVDSTLDESDANVGDGICASGGGHCTLRAAAEETAPHSAQDTINLPAGTYVLSLGQIELAGVDLAGAGRDSVFIDGGGTSRVLHTLQHVTISGVTVTNGAAAIMECGGGIWSEGSLTLESSRVTLNSADQGGGICTGDNDVVLHLTVVDDNTASVSDGGGILIAGAFVDIVDSTVEGNQAAVNGGGIGNPSGNLHLTRSTVSGNHAGGDGGGIHSDGTYNELRNATISGNDADGSGGGLALIGGGDVVTNNATITANRCDADANGSGDGGGIYNEGAGGGVFLTNTILSGNTDTGNQGADCSGPSFEHGGYNILGSLVGCIPTGSAPGAILGQPDLGPLADNGGPTKTHRLLAASPAFDAGSPALSGEDTACEDDDQRGVMRGATRCDIGAFEASVCGNGAREAGENCDDGNTRNGDCCSSTCQFETAELHSFTVDSTADAIDANPGDGVCATAGGACTLRAAANEAGSHCGHDTISLGAGTYTLSLAGAGEQAGLTGDVDLSGDVTIGGAGLTATVINGAGLDRVFDVHAGAASFHDLSITGGDTLEAGGGVLVDDSGYLYFNQVAVYGNHGRHGGGVYAHGLELQDCDIHHNVAAFSGGGIDGQGEITDCLIHDNQAFIGGGLFGSFMMFECTVSGNTANDGGGMYIGSSSEVLACTVSGNYATGTIAGSGYGGGVLIDNSDDVHLDNSTISGNYAAKDGGGVSIFNGVVMVESCTITDNVADSNNDGLGDGGGIYSSEDARGPTELLNNIIALNFDRGDQAPDCGGDGPFTSEGYNLFTTLAGCTLSGDPSGNQIGVDPLIGPLLDNGGPTKTHALLFGSPAIDTGDGCEMYDQRYFDRPQGVGCDIGALEALDICGDHQTTGPEVCDDGGTVDGDGCDSNCTLTGCGNRIVTAGELCDDGNPFNGDGCENDCTTTPISVSVSAAPHQTVSTDLGGGASPSQTLVTSITTPNGGTVTIDQTPPTAPPSGFALFGQQVLISAPPASTGEPLVLSFRVDASQLPPGADPLSLQLLRDGAPVADCNGAPGEATPDPCISDRVILGDGDAQITCLTSNTDAAGFGAFGAGRTAFVGGGGASSSSSVWSLALPTHDSAVFPLPPLKVVLTAEKPTITRNLRVRVRNADIAPQLVRLVIDGSDCPAAVVTDTFVDIPLPAKSVRSRVVPLTLQANDFTTPNRLTPQRCTLHFSTEAVPADSSIDPTPANNTASVELNVFDRTDAVALAASESVLRSVAPVTVLLGQHQAGKTKTIGVKVINAELGGEPQPITVVVTDGDCPAGVVGDAAFAGPAASSSVTLKPGRSALAKLMITVDPSKFSTPNRFAPARCTAHLSAHGTLAPDGEPSNDVTDLIIDVVDRHDD